MAEIQKLLNNLELNGGTPDEWRALQAKISALNAQYEAGWKLIARYRSLPSYSDYVHIEADDDLRFALDTEASAYLTAVI